MSTMRSMIALTLVVSVMLLVDPGCHHVVAAPRADLREPPLAKSMARDREVYTEKILAVLEPRLVDAAARARAAEKLATLSDARLRLMAALSDREPQPSVAQRRERSEEHTSELQSLRHLVCRLLLEKKKTK